MNTVLANGIEYSGCKCDGVVLEFSSTEFYRFYFLKDFARVKALTRSAQANY